MSNSGIAGQKPQGVSHEHHWVEILPLPVRLTGAMLSPSKDAQLESDTCSPEKDGDEILVSGEYRIAADTPSLRKVNGRNFGDFRSFPFCSDGQP